MRDFIRRRNDLRFLRANILAEVPMFKSSMRILLVLGFAVCSGAFAQGGNAAGAAAAETKPGAASTQDVPAKPKPLELADNAPDRYVVQQGDTLWSIATKFLKEPWRWPELWRYNKDQIRDPHAIYPGYVLTLERAGTGAAAAVAPTPAAVPPATQAGPTAGAAPQPAAGSAATAQAGEAAAPRLVVSDKTVKLSPRTRVTPLGPEAIPTIPRSAIEPWLSRPLAIEENDLDDKPRVIATEEGRYNVGGGDKVYVEGIADRTEREWQIYRRGAPLVDPDTDETIAYEAVYLGRAQVMKRGNPSILQIVTATQEIAPGDRLLPVTRSEIPKYLPHAPDTTVRARIVSVVGNRSDAGLLATYSPALAESGRENGYEAQREAGPLQMIAINKGAKDGLEFGNVLALHSGSKVKFDRSVGPLYLGSVVPATIALPEERYGLIFIVRAFDHVAYALVMEASKPLLPGDLVLNP